MSFFEFIFKDDCVTSFHIMPSGTVYVYGRGDALPSSVVRVNVTSKSKELEFQGLSPFYVGGIDVEPFDDGVKYPCKRFENAWQFRTEDSL